MAGSAIQARSRATMAATSSRTMARAASWWPSRRSRSISVWPDLSSASTRVSETVRTAMLTGRNGRLSSVRAIGDDLGRRAVQLGIDRPAARGDGVERRGRFAEAPLVDPVAGHHPLDELAGLVRRHVLDEKQRIRRAVEVAPLRQIARP